MTTTTLEKPSAPTPSLTPVNRPAPAKANTLLIGLDLGTNKSCVLVGPTGSADITVSKVVPSVVGYVKDGIVDGIITGNARVLFGE
jgi:rod shape-determining protein MreB